MAEEVQIASGSQPAKVRSPVVTALLSLVPFYSLFWWYYINRELRDLGQAKGADLGQNPTNSVLALFPGGIVVIPAIMTLINGGKRIQQAQQMHGHNPLNGWLAVVLFIVFSPLGIGYFQSELNKVWESVRSGGAGSLPSGGTGAGTTAPPTSTPEQPSTQQPMG